MKFSIRRLCRYHALRSSLLAVTTVIAAFTATSALANSAPTASFSASATSGTAPLTVMFKGQTSKDRDGRIVDYRWNLAGQSGSGPVAKRVFDQPGDYVVTLTVTDNGGASATSDPMTIRVVGDATAPDPTDPVQPAPGNTAPAISGTPAGSVTVGSTYAFRPVASDADGDPLTFAIRNKPSWAVFSAATGALTGTPSASAAGTYSNVEISVTDGTATTALPAFAIDVVASPNSPPVISGNPPASVTTGANYTFQPTASDADGDRLTFSIRNKPSWASFDTGSGRLSGIPSVADLGQYSNVQVSVSDGSATASLPNFTIDVVDVANGSVTLNWTPPTQNTDGSALTDLAGYRIGYGQSANDLSKVITLMNAGLTSAVIESLTAGTWYFAVKAVNAAGVESDYSAVASKSVW
jgi:PKD repeat protein